MQAMKKSKKKPAAKSAPEKAKKTKQVKEEQNEKQPLLKTLIFGEEKPDLMVKYGFTFRCNQLRLRE